MWYFGNSIEGNMDIDLDDLWKYGFEWEQDYIWSGCSCAFEEGDEEDYCHRCYESAQEHEEENEEPPDIHEDCTRSVEIDRDKFTEVCVPWLLENQHIKKYVSSLSMRYDPNRFNPSYGQVKFIQVKTLPCSDEEQEILDIYILLKQVEYFFQKSKSDCCAFGVQ